MINNCANIKASQEWNKKLRVINNKLKSVLQNKKCVVKCEKYFLDWEELERIQQQSREARKIIKKFVVLTIIAIFCIAHAQIEFQIECSHFSFRCETLLST